MNLTQHVFPLTNNIKQNQATNSRFKPFLFKQTPTNHPLPGSALAILAVLSFLIVVSASLLYLVESDRCEERGLPCHGFDAQQ